MISRFLKSKIFYLILVVGLLGVAFVNYHKIYDWYRLRGYIPSTAIQSLVTGSSMNSVGQHIFYVTHPELDAVDDFRQKCTDSEQTIVLGCFKDDQDIYIRDVTDERLSGVEEVTAAHEMLHAAYSRLSSSEKTKVDKMVADAYAQITDSRIRQTIKSYEDKDKSSVPNELHSIIGTEISSLPKELENYYSKYFTNRQVVVALANQYEAEFTGRREAVTNYDAQLETMKAQISTLQSSLDAQVNSIRSEKARLDALIAGGNVAAYNAGVAAYNSSVNAYNAKIKTLQSSISTYNSTVATRNDIAKQLGDLVDSIDTRVPDNISR